MLRRTLLAMVALAAFAPVAARVATAQEIAPGDPEPAREGVRLELELSAEELAEQAEEFAEQAENLLPELAEGADTLANTQFYQDIEYFHGWHIQQNVVLQHYRLLDEDDRRHTWGTLAHCREFLEDIKVQQQLPPMSGTAVIVLHGLGGWRHRMQPLCEYLEEETDYTIINVCYPSTRSDLGGHALALAGIIERLDGIERIYLVAHSMGNIVARRYLADNTDPATGQQGDPRIERFVMLAPPNQGAELAGKFAENTLYTLVLGDAAVELSPESWPNTERHLATPNCPFGILAGSFMPETGGNPLITGADDFMVAVEETKLPGASDFAILELNHGDMNADPVVCEYTLRFLEEGYFISEEARSPLPREDEAEQAPAGEEPAEPADAVGEADAAEAAAEDNPFADPFGDRLVGSTAGEEAASGEGAPR